MHIPTMSYPNISKMAVSYPCPCLCFLVYSQHMLKSLDAKVANKGMPPLPKTKST